MIRISYLTFLLVFAYRRLRLEKKIDWLKESEGAESVDGLEYKNIYHAVIFPAYKEGLDILIPSVTALEQANYPKDKMIVVVSVEERAGADMWNNALLLKEKFNGHFFDFLVTRHPDNIAGEDRGFCRLISVLVVVL